MDPASKEQWRLIGKYGTIGVEITAIVIMSLFGGQWLDSRFGTAPWCFIGGAAVGLGALIRLMVRVAREYGRDTQQP
jgi:ATP synthase protein I